MRLPTGCCFSQGPIRSLPASSYPYFPTFRNGTIGYFSNQNPGRRPKLIGDPGFPNPQVAEVGPSVCTFGNPGRVLAF